jgi:predicted acylesterase/phospholipase RssA
MALVEMELRDAAEAANLSVAILPADPDAPLDEFVRLLSTAVAEYDTALDISARSFDEALGEGSAQDDVDLWDETDRKAVTWIAEQERNHRFLLYETDAEYSAWTRRCVRQADRIYIVARAQSDPSLTEGELDLFSMKSGAKLIPKELILLQPADVEIPSGTEDWLALRPGLSAVHHVKMSEPSHMLRLARFLTGRAVGLVLGGGGARGNAHIGVIEALQELGVPIDAVGGTSAGGGVAAMLAADRDTTRMRHDNHHAFVEMAPFSAFEIPYHSLIQKKRVEAPAQWLYGDLNIEDLWLSFFCVSCDLARSETVVHRRGRLWKAVRATTALPVVLPPMHLRGKVLIDGGVVDNTPIGEMKAHHSGPCILVNVSPKEAGMMGDDIIDLPTNRDVLMSIIHPFEPRQEVPSVGTVIVRTMTMSNTLEASIKMADLYLTPAIAGYGVVEFESINELVALGYNATMQAFEERREDAEFLAKFGLKVTDIAVRLPRVDVPYWEGERRRAQAAIRQTVAGYAFLASLGAVFGWITHWLWFTEAETISVVAFFAILATLPAVWRGMATYLPKPGMESEGRDP